MLACTYNVDKDVAAAIVIAVVAVYPLYELGYPTAVADRKYAAIDDFAVTFIVMDHCEYVAVGNTDVSCFAVGDMFVNGLVYCGDIKFVSYIEIFFHIVSWPDVNMLAGVKRASASSRKFNNLLLIKQF